MYYVNVKIDNDATIYGQGVGYTKKEAEKQAAQKALQVFKNHDETSSLNQSVISVSEIDNNFIYWSFEIKYTVTPI